MASPDNAAESAESVVDDVSRIDEGLSNIGLHSFDPPASCELLIGAYSDLFSKFKSYEMQLEQKKRMYIEKLPEIEKSINLVVHLKRKKDAGQTVVTRYNLADTIYSKAEVDCTQGIVNLWLGANVMLEYTYDEALELLLTKQAQAKKDYKEVSLFGVFYISHGVLSLLIEI